MAIIMCPKCGAKNRVDERAEQLQPVCGNCGTKLDVTSGSGGPSTNEKTAGPITVTDATFERDVLQQSKTPVLVDCWAQWCPPCRAIAPTIDRLAAESQGRYVIAKLNTDENRRAATQYQIEAIPTLLLFKNGELVDRIVGLAPKEKIERKLKALL